MNENRKKALKHILLHAGGSALASGIGKFLLKKFLSDNAFLAKTKHIALGVADLAMFSHIAEIFSETKLSEHEFVDLLVGSGIAVAQSGTIILVNCTLDGYDTDLPPELGALLRGAGDGAMVALAGWTFTLFCENYFGQQWQINKIYKQGSDYLDQGNHTNALSCFEQLTSMAPNLIEPWINRCICLHYLERNRECVQVADHVIQQGGSIPNLWDIRGTALLVLGDIDNARSSYQTAIEIDPDYSTGWYNLACVHARLGNHDDALDCLARAISIEPTTNRQLATDDQDFDSLRGDHRFLNLVYS